MDSPQEKPLKLATKCPHVDRPEKARGMCQSCYRAAKRAEELESGKVKLDEERGTDSKGEPVEGDLATDPTAVKRFYAILWQWLEDGVKAAEPIITVDKKGKPTRNFQLEARMRESTDQRAMKAATVLGRAYIVERHADEKPSELPVEGMGDIVSGWMKTVTTGKQRREDA